MKTLFIDKNDIAMGFGKGGFVTYMPISQHDVPIRIEIKHTNDMVNLDFYYDYPSEVLPSVVSGPHSFVAMDEAGKFKMAFMKMIDVDRAIKEIIDWVDRQSGMVNLAELALHYKIIVKILTKTREDLFSPAQ